MGENVGFSITHRPRTFPGYTGSHRSVMVFRSAEDAFPGHLPGSVSREASREKNGGVRSAGGRTKSG